MGDSKLKIDGETIKALDHTLKIMEYGEIILKVHDGEVVGIDTKIRNRVK